MIRRFYVALPGSPIAKVSIMVLLALMVLTLLVILFDWAGQFLDTGGTVG